MEKRERDESIKSKKDIKLIIIAILIILVLCMGLSRCQNERANNPKETVIEAPPEETMTDNTSDSIRIRINTYLTVENGEITNLQFSNYNAGELMELEIIANERSIYRSSKIQEGEIIDKAKVKTGSLKYGENKAIAQICYYKADGTYEGQTNFEIKLLYI